MKHFYYFPLQYDFKTLYYIKDLFAIVQTDIVWSDIVILQ